MPAELESTLMERGRRTYSVLSTRAHMQIREETGKRR